jgi:KRAB domain-containing zinc finger protein
MFKKKFFDEILHFLLLICKIKYVRAGMNSIHYILLIMKISNSHFKNSYSIYRECQKFRIISPTTSELNARQRAEVEVTEYLKLKRLSIGDDPFLFWTGDYATKWSLLAKLARKYFSAPATSAESERLFSTAGQIITNLRSSLKDENVEKLLFLHHNIKIYDFNYV